jgi:class 3 adenylate cyclase
LCLADHGPRTLSDAEMDALVELGHVASREIAMKQMIDVQEEQLRLQREKELLFDQLQAEKCRAESFLLSLMPGEIAQELSESGQVEPRYFHDVTVLFTDFVGFSRQTEEMAAEELVHLLNQYFSAFDGVVERYGMEKLKTIGDSYMCVGGMPETNASHPVDAVLAGLEMRNIVHELGQSAGETAAKFDIRVGIHTGPVVAGVVGTRRFAYDVWGETVNLASRMESSGSPGFINISERTHARVKDFFQCEHRGRVTTKDNQEREMYYVRGLQQALRPAAGEAGLPAQFQRRYKTYFRRELRAFPRIDPE